MSLDNTNAVCAENNSSINEERSEGYYNLLSYIVSNTISGEIMAIENYSELVRILPTIEEKFEANQQAWDESKHILLLKKLAKNLDIKVQDRIIEPQWLEIRKQFSRAVKKNDIPACFIIQDIMTETMAIVLYTVLVDKADADTVHIAKNILADELEHLEIGKSRLKKFLADDSDAVHDALIWAHHKIMPTLFSMISTSCHYLCDELGLDCGSLSLEDMKLDLDTVRVDALEHYLETLHDIGFKPAVINSLAAAMSTYEESVDLSVYSKNQSGVNSGECCPPTPKCC